MGYIVTGKTCTWWGGYGAEEAQDLGIGNRLGEAAISNAKSLGIQSLYLEGNTSLKSSIHLYKKLGFKEVPSGPSSYKRVNIVMELELDRYET